MIFPCFFVFNFCLQQTKIKNKPLLKSYFYYLNLGFGGELDVFTLAVFRNLFGDPKGKLYPL